MDGDAVDDGGGGAGAAAADFDKLRRRKLGGVGGGGTDGGAYRLTLLGLDVMVGKTAELAVMVFNASSGCLLLLQLRADGGA